MLYWMSSSICIYSLYTNFGKRYLSYQKITCQPKARYLFVLKFKALPDIETESYGQIFFMEMIRKFHCYLWLWSMELLYGIITLKHYFHVWIRQTAHRITWSYIVHRNYGFAYFSWQVSSWLTTILSLLESLLEIY